MFLTAATAADASRNFLGIEVSGGYARMTAGKLAQAGSPNGAIIHGDAMQLVCSLLPDCCVAGVHVYFPDPWWKARHRKRRILNPLFLRHAARILPEAGRLHIWTDVEEYFEEAVAATAATGLFETRRGGSTGRAGNPLSHPLRTPDPARRRAGLAGRLPAESRPGSGWSGASRRPRSGRQRTQSCRTGRLAGNLLAANEQPVNPPAIHVNHFDHQAAPLSACRR